MATQIVILENYRGTGLGDTDLRHLFWFPIPQARRVPIPGKVSVYRNATPEENAALADGSVIEEVYTVQIPSGTTANAVRALLINRYNSRGTELSNLPNVNQYYGNEYDGNAWS